MSNAQSKFVKQVLVKKGEYDRLRQRQFRDYSPEVRVMGKLQEEILIKLMDKSLDAQTRLDLVSGLLQRFNKLKEETNTLRGATDAKSLAVPDGLKVEAVKQTKENTKQAPDNDAAVPVKNEHVKIAHSEKMDKLMNIISFNPNIIRRNDQNELEVNGQAVPSSNFDELYAAILTPKKSQHMVGMTEILSALRQLNVESKDIVFTQIKSAYESGASRFGPLRHNEKALPSEPQNARKRKPKAAPKYKYKFDSSNWEFEAVWSETSNAFDDKVQHAKTRTL